MNFKFGSNRRDFLKKSVQLTLASNFVPFFSGFSSFAQAAQVSRVSQLNEKEPHFFIQILLAGGADPSYLFDARPLAMTQAGKIQNYLGEVPLAWQGTNDQSCLVTSLVNPLKPFRDYFSVLNGVMMATGFDGHPQNLNYLLTGEAFGGECFIPHLNHSPKSGKRTVPVDAVQKGYVEVALTNAEAIIPLVPSSASELIAKLKQSQTLDPATRLFEFIQSRYRSNIKGADQFSLGSAALSEAFSDAPRLAEILKKIELDKTSGQSADQAFLDLVLAMFRGGAAKSALLVFDPEGAQLLDAHDLVRAKRHPILLKLIIEEIAAIFKRLIATPYDGQRSMMDVTTVFVSSEFGRTMRQEGKSIDQTGTDHNPYSNSLLVGGKGIRGGQVLGASDFQLSDEKLSKAHLSIDPPGIKIMGRPFDLKSGSVVGGLPQTFHAEDYLQIASVINSIYSVFGVDRKFFRTANRSGPIVPVLNRLIV